MEERAGISVAATTLQPGITVLGWLCWRLQLHGRGWECVLALQDQRSILSKQPNLRRKGSSCEHLLWCTTSWTFFLCVWVLLELSSLKSRRHDRFLLDLIAWVHINLWVKQNRCLVIKISKATSVCVSKFDAGNEIKISLFLGGTDCHWKEFEFLFVILALEYS